MNLLNRILMIVITLTALAAVTLATAAPSESLAIAGVLSGNLKSFADRLLPAGRALVAVAGLAIDLLLLLWLWLEIGRTRRRAVRVRRTEGAVAEVANETLAERLEYAVDALPSVVKARARVHSYGRSVEVTMEATILPGTAVAAQADEIAAAVREVTETTMGLALRGKPRVYIKAIRFPKEAFAEPEAASAPPGVPAAAAGPLPEAPRGDGRAEGAAEQAAEPKNTTERPSP